MRYETENKSGKHFVRLAIIILNILFFLTIISCAAPTQYGLKPYEQTKVLERWYSDDSTKPTIGIANLRNIVSMEGTASIEENKQKILDTIDVLKKYDVNMILFPEFSLTGYFWDESQECWDYMKKGVTDNHLDWLAEIKSKLDDKLKYIVFNNIRLNPDKPDGKFLNSTYIVDKDFDCTALNTESNEKFRIYDKTFLPGIEKVFTKSGKKDILVLDTEWGRFGFTTCYDMCFTQIFQSYAMFDNVDAVVELASWRGSAEREYPKMNVKNSNYYGFQWNLMAPSQAAFNQIWVIAANAVGTQKRGDYMFWGGSGVWAPSGLKLIQASNNSEELIIVHNLDIKGQTKFEHDDFYYYDDFIKIYAPIMDMRSFTRMNGSGNN